jgi:uncharacterized protein YeaO (DUF488 family)
LLDIRLNNKTQLAGFTKCDDLAYFLKEICNCNYEHKLEFAPTKDILDDYKDKKISWNEYEYKYKKLIQDRNSKNKFCEKFYENYSQYHNIVLLCSEPTPDKCHRRLAAEKIAEVIPSLLIGHL